MRFSVSIGNIRYGAEFFVSVANERRVFTKGNAGKCLFVFIENGDLRRGIAAFGHMGNKGKLPFFQRKYRLYASAARIILRLQYARLAAHHHGLCCHRTLCSLGITCRDLHTDILIFKRLSRIKQIGLFRFRQFRVCTNTDRCGFPYVSIAHLVTVGIFYIGIRRKDAPRCIGNLRILDYRCIIARNVH